MWIIVLTIIAASLIIVVIEFPLLRRKQQKRDHIFFFSMLLLGAGLNIILFATDFELPNPSSLLIFIYKPVYEVLKNMLNV